MKNLNLFIITFLLTAISFAQSNSINYKAIIKDGSGNVVANTAITVQFQILEDITNVYQETHTPTTDANGLIILNIGEGTTVDTYTDINWGSDDHFLKVFVDIGAGLIDMGPATEFMAVPYALNAGNVTGLEQITESGNTGWRLKGRNPANYGDIGDGAIDLSSSPFTSSDKGATGISSLAMGEASKSPGKWSTAMGFWTIADSYFSTVIGLYNIGGGDPTNWNASDPLFEVGNGSSNSSRANALTILKNGTITAPTFDLAEITDDKALITKEYADTNYNSNTLDEAYDKGGLGAGRTINTTDGALFLNGADGMVIKGDAANLEISNNTENESGIHFRDAGNTTQYADIKYDNGTNNILNMYVSSATPMLTLKNNQNVGIGTTEPTEKLSVAGAINLNDGISTGAVALKVNGAQALWFDGSEFSWGHGGSINYFANKVGIGDNNSNYKLFVKDNSSEYIAAFENTDTSAGASGIKVILDIDNNSTGNKYLGFYDGASNVGKISGNFSGNGVLYTTTSDRRLKKSIEDIKGALKIINTMQPRRYEYKTSLGTKEYGFIAQELQEVYPQAVSGSPDSDVTKNPMMVDYSRLTPILTAGIKELNDKVKKLEAKLLNKETAFDTLYNRIEKIEALLNSKEEIK